MKVITFSKFFPVSHPRKGEPTFFVEKIWKALLMQGRQLPMGITGYNHDVEPKWHTIRAGNRWKQGDKFSQEYGRALHIKASRLNLLNLLR